MVNEVIKTISESKEILKEVYTDLAKPGVAQAGKALGTIIGLGNTALSPITLMNEKASIRLKYNLEKYRQKLEDTPEEEICELPPEIGVPVVEKLSYITNEELSDKYTELLAKASKTKTSEQVHPSFANILDNLSPDEILLLNEFVGLTSIQYVEVRFALTNKNGFSILDPHFTEFNELQTLNYPANVNVYLNNLERLGILKNQGSIYMQGAIAEEKYNKLIELAEKKYEALKAVHSLLKQVKLSESNEVEGAPKATILTDQLLNLTQDREIKCNKGKMEITSYGTLFLKAISSEEKTSE